MTGIVIDASVALAWCFPDEASEYADGYWSALEGRAILVPALWSVENHECLLWPSANGSNNLRSGAHCPFAALSTEKKGDSGITSKQV